MNKFSMLYLSLSIFGSMLIQIRVQIHVGSSSVLEKHDGSGSLYNVFGQTGGIWIHTIYLDKQEESGSFYIVPYMDKLEGSGSFDIWTNGRDLDLYTVYLDKPEVY